MWICILLASSPELVVQTGPGALITQVALSPDDRYMAVGSDSNDVALYDLRKGVLLRRIRGLATPHGIAFSPKGDLLYVNYHYRGVHAHDLLGNRKGGREFQSTLAMLLSPDGARLFTQTFAGIQVVRTKDFGRERDLNFTGAYGSVMAMSHDGKYLVVAVGGGGKEVRVYDAHKLELITTFQAPLTFFNGVSFSGDGSVVVVSSESNTIAYTTGTWKQAWSLGSGRGHQLAPEPKGKGIFAGTISGSFLLDAASGQELARFSLRGDAGVAASSVSRGVLVAEQRNVVRLLDLQTAKTSAFTGTGLVPLNASVSSDGKQFAVAYNDGKVRVWDAQTGRLTQQAPIGGENIWIQYSPDNRYLVTGKAVLDGRTLAEVRRFKTPAAWRISASNTHAVAFQENLATVMSLETGEVEWKTPKGYDQAVVTPDGKYVVGATFQGVDVYDLASHQLVKSLSAKLSNGGMAVSPDSTMLVIGDLAQAMHLISLPDLREIRTCASNTGSMLTSIAFSADGKRFVTGHWKSGFETFVFNTETCAIEHRNSDQTGEVKGVGFVNDGKHIISSGTDSTTVQWHALDNGRLVVTAIALEGGGFVSFTPDRHYVAARTASDAIRFSDGMKSFAYDLFDLRLNRPDLVMKAIGVVDAQTIDVYYRAYLKRLARMGYAEKDLVADLEVPEIEVSPTGDGVDVRARGAKKVTRLLVAVNGVLLDGATGRAWKGNTQVPIALAAGENEIQVSVLNAAGAESERVRLTRTGPAAKSNTYVYAVGVSKYKESGYDLDYAAKDAADLAALFPGATVMTDAQVTREGLEAIRAQLLRTQVDDVVVLFFAGHGLLDDKLDFYYATHDVSFSDPARRGIPFTTLEGLLEGIPARKKLLLMDTCHSGEVDKDELAVGGVLASGDVKRRGIKRIERKMPPLGMKLASDLQRELFNELKMGSGATVLTSAAGAQYALESPQWNNGVFTYSLLKGIKERDADSNKDRLINVSELRDYVGRLVPSLTQGQQTPTARAVNEKANFVLY